MTDNENIINVDEENAEVTVRFTKIKKAFSKVKPVHVAIATTAVVTAAGMILVSRLDKVINTLDNADTIVIETETTPEV